jgi:hypothetical protein
LSLPLSLLLIQSVMPSVFAMPKTANTDMLFS